MEYQGRQFLQGIITDITETVNLRNRMSHLFVHLPESIFLLRIREGRIEFRLLSEGFFAEYGYTAESLDQYVRTRFYNDTVYPENLRQIRQDLLKAMKKIQNLRLLSTYIFLRKNHSLYHWKPAR